MTCSVQRPRLVRVAGVSPVMLLATCSPDLRYKRQVNDDESYLEAALLAGFHAPAGVILSVMLGDYSIPATNDSGAVGKALNIRPPARPLALVTGACIQIMDDMSVLPVENGRSNTL